MISASFAGFRKSYCMRAGLHVRNTSENVCVFVCVRKTVDSPHGPINNKYIIAIDNTVI